MLEEHRFSPGRTGWGQHSGDISVLAAPRGTTELPVLTLTAEWHAKLQDMKGTTLIHLHGDRSGIGDIKCFQQKTTPLHLRPTVFCPPNGCEKWEASQTSEYGVFAKPQRTGMCCFK